MRHQDNTVRYEAPAKVNLSLLVHPPDAGGMHPLDSIVQTVDWLDHLVLAGGESEDSLTIEGLEIDAEENLVLAASRLVRETTHFSPVHHILEKAIPAGAGLGGGGSDAAATLQSHVDRGRISPQQAHALAPKLGADVRLFLEGGSQRVRGHGEKLTELAPLRGFAMLVVVPEFRLSTVEVYRRWDRLEGPEGEAFTEAALPPDLRDGMPMRNDLLPAALDVEPLLGDFMADLRHVLGADVGLTGSGSACFAYFTDVDEAASAGASAERIGDVIRVVEPRPVGVARTQTLQPG